MEPNTFKVSTVLQLGKEFLKCDQFIVEDIHVDDQRHLIFSTAVQLQILYHPKKWYCDGTFKLVKVSFAQLRSIHAFIKKGESMKHIPLVFVFVSRKRTRDYKPISLPNMHINCYIE